jgi:hypothetical protein
MIVYKYDEYGKYIEPVEIGENNPIPKNCTVKELPQPNNKPYFDETKNDWVETADQEEILKPLKEAKMSELDALCNAAIVAGFDYEINFESYHFSCSLAAQANFQGTDTLFKDGLISEAEWTVINNKTGLVERITFDQDIFNQLKLQVFLHINGNTKKLRNVLEPQVIAAQSQTELDQITW